MSYTISVNRNRQNIKEVTLEDHLKFTSASYVKDSIKVIKGKFAYVDGEWQFSDRVDVTDQHKITIAEDGQSFVIDLGDITEADQYRISYIQYQIPLFPHTAHPEESAHPCQSLQLF